MRHLKDCDCILGLNSTISENIKSITGLHRMIDGGWDTLWFQARRWHGMAYIEELTRAKKLHTSDHHPAVRSNASIMNHNAHVSTCLPLMKKISVTTAGPTPHNFTLPAFNSSHSFLRNGTYALPPGGNQYILSFSSSPTLIPGSTPCAFNLPF